MFDTSDGKWKHVIDAVAAERTSQHVQYVYNLVTSAHRVLVNNTLLSDWDEVDSDVDQILARLNTDTSGQLQAKPLSQYNQFHPKQANATKHQLVKPTLLPSPTTRKGENGFLSGTMVSRGSGQPPIEIEKLQPGDRIEGGTVLAVVSEAVQSSEAHFVRYDNQPLPVARFTVVLDQNDGIWRHVHNSPLATLINPTATNSDHLIRLYQLITSSHHIVIDGTIFSDYEMIEHDDACAAENLAVLNTVRSGRVPGSH